MLIARDRHTWSQALCFDGELAVAEPNRLRHPVCRAAAVIAHTGRPADRATPSSSADDLRE